MSTTPLKIDIIENGTRRRDWQPRKSDYKVPWRVFRLCVLGVFLPSILIAGPIYLRFRVFCEQLYPVTISDQRLIDSRMSTTWCQSQRVRANATFNAYLMSEAPIVEKEAIPVSMTRHLILEDDMKEYWGFYLLGGSSVTVSTCVRWPGASLTIIRGHKHLHECAFIGDDSSEELEELVEVAQEQGLLNGTATSLSNIPEKMRRAGNDIHFHHEGNVLHANVSENSHHTGSHELDTKTMRNILTQLFAKTLDMKKKKKENPHHHYDGVFKEFANIDKPPIANYSPLNPPPASKSTNRFSGSEKTSESNKNSVLLLPSASSSIEEKQNGVKLEENNSTSSSTLRPTLSNIQTGNKAMPKISKKQEESANERMDSAEVFQDILRKISSLGDRGKHMLRKIMDEIDAQGNEGDALKQLVHETMNDKSLSSEVKRKRKRDLVLSSPLHHELTEEDESGDPPLEEGMLNPDGIAEDRGTVNETTMNDRSNSEFWSSFSSSEERLLECKGLILNLPLTPHRYCTPQHEGQHSTASFANAVTYRVPLNGYYFFVFNSENEIQPNYLRVQFDLLKIIYNTSNPVSVCKNSTQECLLPFKIFSNEKTVLELPLSGNDSQWNEEYVVVSTCEPRTMIYATCCIMAPLLILFFAFQ